MHNIFIINLLIGLLTLLPHSVSVQLHSVSIVIHGGAGNITPANLAPEKQALYEASLSKALGIGYAILTDGGSSEEAVKSVIIHLENDTLFNAGRGAVLTHNQQVSHDASIMTGNDLNAGAIAGTSRIKNPILGALAVKDYSKHVFLSDTGAEDFAESQKLEMVDPSYFITDRRVKQLHLIIKDENKNSGYYSDPFTGNGKFGTVGCVAIDQNGNITAATSTGGMMNKKNGRIGDSPIIGAGTYADNSTCGVSCTGHGEYFIRIGVAKEISDQIKYGNASLNDAAQNTIFNSLENLGGTGGIIAIDTDGNIVIKFNTSGMFRAWQKEGDKPQVKMFD